MIYWLVVTSALACVQGNTALMISVREGEYAIAKLLLNRNNTQTDYQNKVIWMDFTSVKKKMNYWLGFARPFLHTSHIPFMASPLRVDR